VTEDQYLPVLSYILKHGNVTVYQWKHEEAPVPDQTERNGNEAEEPGIDWGLGSAVVSREDGGIDFGEIDFGDTSLGDLEEGVAIITLEESGEGGTTSSGGQGSHDENGGVVGQGSHDENGGVVGQGSQDEDGGEKTSQEYSCELGVVG
jgi:hypothetical protein